MTTEPSLRKQLCEIGNRMWQRGLIAAYDGNISVRMDSDRILCTPSGVSKGFLKSKDLLITDLSGNVIGSQGMPSSEIKMHLEIYRYRSDIQSVVHAHPPYATAFALAGRGVPSGVMPEIDGILGDISFLEYAPPGSQQLADGFRSTLDSSNVFLLSRHGATTIGINLEEAWFRMESLEHCCRILTISSHIK